MLNHFRGTTGYAFLYLTLFFSITGLTLLFSGLSRGLGVTNAGHITGGVIFAAFWIIGFIVMQRFIAIEGRRPTIAEANLVGVKNVLTVLGTVLALAMIVGLVVLLTKIFGGDGGAGGAEAGSRGRGRGGGGEDNAQAIQGLWGVMATLLLFYAAPFLNLGLVSRLFAPKS